MQFEEEIFFRTIANQGELLSVEQVEECLEIQKQSSNPGSLFVLMIEKGYINNKNMAAILKKAPPEMQREAGKKEDQKKFGELCVEKGFASSSQIAEALALQERLKKEGKHFRIGQILIEKKYVAMRQAQLILEIQGKKILRCPSCETKYNIRHYKTEKKYQCPKCSGDLISSQPGASMSVERSFMSRDSVDVDDEALSLLHKKIGDYEIVELLGEGGMADVYKVVSRFRKRPRALKVMKAQAGFERFNREFESAHSLRHPNIIRVYDTGKIEGRPYFFMEYMDGGTLSRRIEKMGIIPLREALSVLKQIAMGLKYAHENNIIHRDIKPSNILLGQDSSQEIVAKIADFGIARTTTDNQITVTGQLVGTFKYMSPEYIRGLNIDGHADIFSLGIVAYEMFTGREPFNVDGPVGYLFVNIKENPPQIHQVNPDLPKFVSLIVSQMLSKDVKVRYDASALLRDLDRVLVHLRENTKLVETEDRTSVFYTKGTLSSLKGLWDKIFTKSPNEKTEEPSVSLSSESADDIISNNAALMETEEVGKDATAEKQYEFALDLIQQGNMDGAKKHLQALIEIFPASPWAVRAKKRLNKIDSPEETPTKEKDSSVVLSPKKKQLQ
ncbi:MAG: protein kinase [Candidatus Brocadiae bacterium]|nr:protein kinase [Candidatus Brocadiia bacterium]